MKEEPVWGNEVVSDKLSTALDTCFSGQTVAALGFTAVSQQSREIPLMRADLPKRHVTSSALQGLQLMTNDYIKGNAGFYMTLEGFSNSICISREMRTHGREDSIFSSLSPARSCYHSNKRLRVPLVSSAHGRQILTRELSGLESLSYAYSAADYHGRKYFCGNYTEWHGQPTFSRCSSSFLGRAPSEHHVAAPTTDSTPTSNDAGTRKAERRDRRQHNCNSR